MNGSNQAMSNLLRARVSAVTVLFAAGVFTFACKEKQDAPTGSGAAAGSSGTAGQSAGEGGAVEGTSGAGGEAIGGVTSGGADTGAGGVVEAGGAVGSDGGAPLGGEGGNAGLGGDGGAAGAASDAGEVVEIAAGSAFGCALLSTGSVKCWGDDSFGTLGDGGAAAGRWAVARDVAGLGKAKRLAAAGATACAIRDDDTARCWGFNIGEAIDVAGDPATITSPAPLKGLGDAAVLDVTVGSNASRVTSHGCIVTANNSVGCWGRNESLQLGAAAATGDSVVITASLGSYTAVVAGRSFSCGLTTGKGVKCWGSAASGQLGNNDPEALPTAAPVQVTGLASGVEQIAASSQTVCALTSSGGVKCWGDPSYGAVGAAEDLHQYNGIVATPIDVSGLTSGVSAIAGGTRFFCALMAPDGSIRCWGYNQNGQLGNQPNPIAINEYEPLPVQVSGITGATALALGADHACAIMADGGVKCWGSGTGSGSDLTSNQLVPTYVRGL